MKHPRPHLSILIVSYNTREMTLACIRSVLRETVSCRIEIILVDNASSDGSPEAIEKEFPQLRVIRLSENVGFARANNRAAKFATGNLILLLNPDTVVLNHAMDMLCDFASAHTEAQIWGGRTVFSNGNLNRTSCWRFISNWSLFVWATGLTAIFRNSNLFNPEAYGGWNRDTVQAVDIVSGCFLLVTREIWVKLGGFDEDFFMYAEEADLCYRARRLGARPLFTPDATILHYGSASERILSTKIIRLLSGKVTFLKKHWARPRRFLGLTLLRAAVLVRALGYSALSSITRSMDHGAAAQEWRRVWALRGQWADGYANKTE